ncbi:hypothetical protein UY3_09732 [Chelonia mydas]|uniref:Uncharacterized protein n=1 Tax=Chelonia mydas TaxID=8469 RepID=M7BC65_CHEMY|nr:hypothetical protein UY3_09732 [Chelonia mydas]
MGGDRSKLCNFSYVNNIAEVDVLDLLTVGTTLCNVNRRCSPVDSPCTSRSGGVQELTGERPPMHRSPRIEPRNNCQVEGSQEQVGNTERKKFLLKKSATVSGIPGHIVLQFQKRKMTHSMVQIQLWSTAIAKVQRAIIISSKSTANGKQIPWLSLKRQETTASWGDKLPTLTGKGLLVSVGRFFTEALQQRSCATVASYVSTNTRARDGQ